MPKPEIKSQSLKAAILVDDYANLSLEGAKKKSDKQLPKVME